MIDLGQRSEPYEIALPYGLSITVKPLTTAGMAAAQAAGRRAVEAIEPQARERTPRLAAPCIGCDQGRSRAAGRRNGYSKNPVGAAPVKVAGTLARALAMGAF